MLNNGSCWSVRTVRPPPTPSTNNPLATTSPKATSPPNPTRQKAEPRPPEGRTPDPTRHGTPSPRAPGSPPADHTTDRGPNGGRPPQALSAALSAPPSCQVDLVAPGEDMFAACLGATELCKTHGTSDATALASASAALIWSKHPDWTNNQVLRVMLNTASKPKSSKERTDYLGYGAVRPRIALQNPGDPGPADEYPLPDLAAAASQSPSPDTSRSNGTDASAKNDHSATTASAPKDDGSILWITLGIGTAVLLGAAITVSAAIRKRRAPAASFQAATIYPSQFPYTDKGFTHAPHSAPSAPGSVDPSGRGPGPA
ncbi:S8 family serine peptidase [Streptomyces sp. NPDC058240]|uniref:S8 family serine peptidase n=1 Tax=Streptomyces sp. NPDC058240 TaxID=3346396 RepID=UPI0036E4CD4A